MYLTLTLVLGTLNLRCYLIPFTDWAHNAYHLTVQRGQNAHYMPVKGIRVNVSHWP